MSNNNNQPSRRPYEQNYQGGKGFPLQSQSREINGLKVNQNAKNSQPKQNQELHSKVPMCGPFPFINVNLPQYYPNPQFAGNNGYPYPQQPYFNYPNPYFYPLPPIHQSLANSYPNPHKQNHFQGLNKPVFDSGNKNQQQFETIRKTNSETSIPQASNQKQKSNLSTNFIPPQKNINKNISPTKFERNRVQQQKAKTPERKYYQPRRQEPNRYQSGSSNRLNNSHQKNKRSTNQHLESERQASFDSRSDSRSSYSEDSFQEEQYPKRKFIFKKKDPVLDNPEQIRRWIEARKRNYPRRTQTAEAQKQKQQKIQLSILQTKIRKKIMLINSDPRSLLKKLRNIDVLRRFIINPKKNQKNQIIQRAKKLEKKSYQPSQEKIITQEPLQEVQQLKISKTIVQQGEQLSQQAIQVPIAKNISSEPQIVEIEVKNIESKSIFSQKDQAPEQYIHGSQQNQAQMIIKHLQSKQLEDKEWLQNMLDYKSNTSNYRYHCQTLETNFVLDDIFKETSFMLQAIRYVVKNNFFEPTEEKQTKIKSIDQPQDGSKF